MSDLVHRKCAGAAAALTGAVLIAGCSTPSTTSAPGQSTSSAVSRTTASAPTTTAVPLPSPPAPVPTNSPAVPQPGAGGSAPAQCQTSGLVVTAGPAAGALEHGGAVVVFTNAGPTCTMTAYPGVNGVDGQQGTIARARRALRGTLGGLPPTEAHPRMVTLRRGQRASALLEGLNARTTGGDQERSTG